MWGFNRGKAKTVYLVIILVVSILGCVLVNATKFEVPYVAYDKQVEAAELMQACIYAIRDKKLDMGLVINPLDDPNETGLIGALRSPLITTKGLLEAKRTSTNPSFAALLVRYFTELDLKPQDVIAIGSSGSFPALALATLCAAEVMELKTIFIYSVGASNYGASIPEYTFIDMLRNLNQLGLLDAQIDALSMGGNEDLFVGEIYELGREIALEIIEKSGVDIFIYEDTLQDSIKKRMEIYFEKAGDRPIECFINAGGASANMGTGSSSFSLNISNGLLKRGSVVVPKDDRRGAMMEFAALGTPVIYLLEINDLALKSNIMIDPSPFPVIGTEGVYKVTVYNKFLISLTLLIVAAILIYISTSFAKSKRAKLSREQI